MPAQQPEKDLESGEGPAPINSDDQPALSPRRSIRIGTFIFVLFAVVGVLAVPTACAKRPSADAYAACAGTPPAVGWAIVLAVYTFWAFFAFSSLSVKENPVTNFDARTEKFVISVIFSSSSTMGRLTKFKEKNQ